MKDPDLEKKNWNITRKRHQIAVLGLGNKRKRLNMKEMMKCEGFNFWKKQRPKFREKLN